MNQASHAGWSRLQALCLSGTFMFLRGASLAQPAVDATLTVRPFVGVAPDTVTHLTALPGALEGSISLSWTAPAVFPGSTLDSYQLRVQTFSVADVGGSTTAWWNQATGLLFQSFYGANPGDAVTRTIGLPPADHSAVLAAGASCYFAVRSADDMGTGMDFWSGSSNQAAAIPKSLTPPALVSPADTAYVSTATPVMTWSGASGSSRLQLAADPGLTQVIADSTTGNAFYVSTNALANATTYWWRVGIAGSPGTWSSTASFVVDIASPAYSGPQVADSPAAASWTNLPMSTYLSTNAVSARITVQDALSGLLLSSGSYLVRYSTDAGATWNVVSTNSVTLSGSDGTNAPQTLEADNIPVVTSTGPGASTNQIAFVASDSVGNVSTAAYVVLVSTVPAPEPPVLSAVVVESTTIRWAWTAPGSAASSFGFYNATGSLFMTLSGNTSFYWERNLSTSTTYSRYMVAQNLLGQAQSNTATVATPAGGSFFVGSGSVTLSGSGGEAVQIPVANLGHNISWLVSENPVLHPLTDLTVVLISSAQAALPAGLLGSAASLTEFIVATDNRRSTGTLALPVVVSVPYPDADHDGNVDGTDPPVPAGTLKLYYLNEATARWEEVPGSTVDLVNHVVSASAGHLSIFTAFGIGALTHSDLSAVRVYPIPYRPNGGDPNRGKPYSAGDPTSGIIFDNLPDVVTIEIYGITGRRVARLDTAASSGKLRWDARNDSGQDVASGGYIAVLSSPGCGRVVKKLIIVR